jgi:hypothetical protein
MAANSIIQEPSGILVVLRGHLDREPRLSDAADAGEGHQPRTAQQSGDLLHFLFSAQEPGRLRRKIADRGVQAVKWRKCLLQAFRADLIEALRPRKVAEPMLAQVKKFKASDRREGRLRDEDLTAVSGRHNASGPIERWPVIVLISLFRLASAYPHANRQFESTLCFDSGVNRRLGL